MAWTTSSIPPQSGRRAIITGANSGIGYWTALELARSGAHVILACRDPERASVSLARLQQEVPGALAEVASLDLASLTSIRAFAATQVAHPLHLLINNAGVMAPRQRRETADGLELQFGTNVIGHFALTGLLFPALAAAATDFESPRVVTLASIAHKEGAIDFDDLQSQRNYSPMRAYRQSKLADLLFAFELDRRLRRVGSPISSVAAHPGVANTNLFHADQVSSFERKVRRTAGRLLSPFLNSEAGGAVPTLFAAVAAEVESGGYYGPQGWLEMRGGDVGRAAVAPQARNEETARRLWNVCEQLSGVEFLSSPA